jgi:hypothetical protein
VAATHWSSRKMAAQIVVRPSTMMRHWQACCTVERLMKRPAGRGQSVNRWSWPRCKGCPGSTVHRRLEPIGYIPSAEAEANCYWQHAVRSPRWRVDANQATSTIPGGVGTLPFQSSLVLRFTLTYSAGQHHVFFETVCGHANIYPCLRRPSPQSHRPELFFKC